MNLLPSSPSPSYLASVSPFPYWEAILLSSGTLALDVRRTLEKILGGVVTLSTGHSSQ